MILSSVKWWYRQHTLGQLALHGSWDFKFCVIWILLINEHFLCIYCSWPGLDRREACKTILATLLLPVSDSEKNTDQHRRVSHHCPGTIIDGQLLVPKVKRQHSKTGPIEYQTQTSGSFELLTINIRVSGPVFSLLAVVVRTASVAAAPPRSRPFQISHISI